MSKYLNKELEELIQQKAEIDAAFEVAQKRRAEILGSIFLRVIDRIDDEKRAKAYLTIIESHATKDEKKALKGMLKRLKSLIDTKKTSQQVVQEKDELSANSLVNSSSDLEDSSG